MSHGKRRNQQRREGMATKHWSGPWRLRAEAAAVFGITAVALLLGPLTPPTVRAQSDRRADRYAAASGQTLVAQQVAPSDRAAVLGSYYSAVDNGDVDGASALFAGNAIFISTAVTGNCSQTTPCADASSIHQFIANVVAGHGCRLLRSVSVSGAVVTGQVEIANDNLRSRGIDYDVSDFIALVPINRIAFIANVDDIADPRNALNVAIIAGTAQPSSPPLPNPATPCAGVPGA
jgi:hypothetical protein